MSRTVYINGEYVAEEDAKISVFDRGFLFADGVYEGTAVLEGKLVDFEAHVARIYRSLNEIDIKPAYSNDELLKIHRELISRNNVQEGFMYMQITRGVADREFLYSDDMRSSLLVFTQSKNLVDSPLAKHGAKIITVEDQRWGRRDIKSIQLISQSMAKNEAHRKRVDDAWLVSEGWVNEGVASNAYIITQDNVIVTRHLSNEILHGITRTAILKCAKKLNLIVEERPFSIEEAINAKEAFLTGSASLVCPVVEIDGQKIGSGKPGEVVAEIRDNYLKLARSQAI